VTEYGRIALVMPIWYQSTVALRFDSSACSNGDLSTKPAVQVSPISDFSCELPIWFTQAYPPPTVPPGAAAEV
jgi:hypothetical protein